MKACYFKKRKVNKVKEAEFQKGTLRMPLYIIYRPLSIENSNSSTFDLLLRFCLYASKFGRKISVILFTLEQFSDETITKLKVYSTSPFSLKETSARFTQTLPDLASGLDPSPPTTTSLHHSR